MLGSLGNEVQGDSGPQRASCRPQHAHRPEVCRVGGQQPDGPPEKESGRPGRGLFWGLFWCRLRVWGFEVWGSWFKDGL